MAVMFMLLPPLLVSVTVCVAVDPTCVLGNVRLDGEKDTAAGVRPVPVPLKATDCGLPLAVSVIWRAPLTGPLAVGLNATVIWHDEPPVRVPRQFWLGTLKGLG